MIKKLIDLENIQTFLKKNISLAAFIVLFILFSLTTDGRFLRASNMITVLGQSMDLLIVALGATFIIMLGSIDLSAGSMVSLISVVSTLTFVGLLGVTNEWIALLATIGAAVGVSIIAYTIMGLIHTRLKVPSFIVTLGMLSIARAVVTMISGGRITIIPFDSVFKTYFGLTPWIIVLGFGLFVVAWLIERYTLFGRYTRLIGGDEIVARLSGINVNKQKLLVFIFAGVFLAIGGIVLAARIGSGSPAIGVGHELNVISAVVLGGTSQRGGIGGVRGTLIGTLTLGVLGNGLILWQMPGEIQLLIRGAILIFAVYISLVRTPNMVIK